MALPYGTKGLTLIYKSRCDGTTVFSCKKPVDLERSQFGMTTDLT